MAVPVVDEATATHSGRAWRRLFRARRGGVSRAV